ncbi:hypothetical protein BD626DRAFT_574677 [Schizophyllum amplum]|uniref:Uncharacterized protein n=1 Tax=Schizophyllum amplum TaxID=97359 RepID=A0A550BXT7_9AGAR|nr:hypothetical protein BD626DRAFT_574677 [Auriculariopsis ampla]
MAAALVNRQFTLELYGITAGSLSAALGYPLPVLQCSSTCPSPLRSPARALGRCSVYDTVPRALPFLIDETHFAHSTQERGQSALRVIASGRSITMAVNVHHQAASPVIVRSRRVLYDIVGAACAFLGAALRSACAGLAQTGGAYMFVALPEHRFRSPPQALLRYHRRLLRATRAVGRSPTDTKAPALSGRCGLSLVGRTLRHRSSSLQSISTFAWDLRRPLLRGDDGARAAPSRRRPPVRLFAGRPLARSYVETAAALVAALTHDPRPALARASRFRGAAVIRLLNSDTYRTWTRATAFNFTVSSIDKHCTGPGNSLLAVLLPRFLSPRLNSLKMYYTARDSYTKDAGFSEDTVDYGEDEEDGVHGTSSTNGPFPLTQPRISWVDPAHEDDDDNEGGDVNDHGKDDGHGEDNYHGAGHDGGEDDDRGQGLQRSAEDETVGGELTGTPTPTRRRKSGFAPANEDDEDEESVGSQLLGPPPSTQRRNVKFREDEEDKEDDDERIPGPPPSTQRPRRATPVLEDDEDESGRGRLAGPPPSTQRRRVFPAVGYDEDDDDDEDDEDDKRVTRPPPSTQRRKSRVAFAHADDEDNESRAGRSTVPALFPQRPKPRIRSSVDERVPTVLVPDTPPSASLPSPQAAPSLHDEIMLSPGPSSQRSNDDANMRSPGAIMDSDMRSPKSADTHMRSPNAEDDAGSIDAMMRSPGGHQQGHVPVITTAVLLERPPLQRNRGLVSLANQIHNTDPAPMVHFLPQAASTPLSKQPTHALSNKHAGPSSGGGSVRNKNAITNNGSKGSDGTDSIEDDDEPMPKDEDPIENTDGSVDYDDDKPMDEEDDDEDDDKDGDEDDDEDDDEDESVDDADIERPIKSMPGRATNANPSQPSASTTSGASKSDTNPSECPTSEVTAEQDANELSKASSGSGKTSTESAARSKGLDNAANAPQKGHESSRMSAAMAARGALLGYGVANLTAPQCGFPDEGPDIAYDPTQRGKEAPLLDRFIGHDKDGTFETRLVQHAIAVVAPAGYFGPGSFTTDTKADPPWVTFTKDSHGNVLIIINGNHRRWYLIRRFYQENDLESCAPEDIEWTDELIEKSNETGSFLIAVYDKDVIDASDQREQILLHLASNNELSSAPDTPSTQVWRVLRIVNKAEQRISDCAIKDAKKNSYHADVKSLVGNFNPSIVVPLSEMSVLDTFTGNEQAQALFAPKNLMQHGRHSWKFNSMLWKGTRAVLHLALNNAELANELNAMSLDDLANLRHPDKGITELFRDAYKDNPDWAIFNNMRFSPIEQELVDTILSACEVAAIDLLPVFKPYGCLGVWTGDVIDEEGTFKSAMMEYWTRVAHRLQGKLEVLASRLGVREDHPDRFARHLVDLDMLPKFFTAFALVDSAVANLTPLRLGYHLPLYSPSIHYYVLSMCRPLHNALRFCISLFAPGGHYSLVLAKPNKESDVSIPSSLELFGIWQHTAIKRFRPKAKSLTPSEVEERVDRVLVMFMNLLLHNSTMLCGGEIEQALKDFMKDTPPAFNDPSIYGPATHVFTYVMCWLSAIAPKKTDRATASVNSMPNPGKRVLDAESECFTNVTKLLRLWHAEVVNNIAGAKSATNGREHYVKNMIRCLVWLDMRAADHMSLLLRFPQLNAIRIHTMSLLSDEKILGAKFRFWHEPYALAAGVLTTIVRHPLPTIETYKAFAKEKKANDKVWVATKTLQSAFTAFVKALTTQKGKPSAVMVQRVGAKGTLVKTPVLNLALEQPLAALYEKSLEIAVRENMTPAGDFDGVLEDMASRYAFRPETATAEEQKAKDDEIASRAVCDDSDSDSSEEEEVDNDLEGLDDVEEAPKPAKTTGSRSKSKSNPKATKAKSNAKAKSNPKATKATATASASATILTTANVSKGKGRATEPDDEAAQETEMMAKKEKAARQRAAKKAAKAAASDEESAGEVATEAAVKAPKRGTTKGNSARGTAKEDGVSEEAEDEVAFQAARRAEDASKRKAKQDREARAKARRAAEDAEGSQAQEEAPRSAAKTTTRTKKATRADDVEVIPVAEDDLGKERRAPKKHHAPNAWPLATPRPAFHRAPRGLYLLPHPSPPSPAEAGPVLSPHRTGNSRVLLRACGGGTILAPSPPRTAPSLRSPPKKLQPPRAASSTHADRVTPPSIFARAASLALHVKPLVHLAAPAFLRLTHSASRPRAFHAARAIHAARVSRAACVSRPARAPPLLAPRPAPSKPPSDRAPRFLRLSHHAPRIATPRLPRSTHPALRAPCATRRALRPSRIRRHPRGRIPCVSRTPPRAPEAHAGEPHDHTGRLNPALSRDVRCPSTVHLPLRLRPRRQHRRLPRLLADKTADAHVASRDSGRANTGSAGCGWRAAELRPRASSIYWCSYYRRSFTLIMDYNMLSSSLSEPEPTQLTPTEPATSQPTQQTPSEPATSQRSQATSQPQNDPSLQSDLLTTKLLKAYDLVVNTIDHWPQLVSDKPKPAIRNAARFPEDTEFPGLREVITAYFDETTESINSVDLLGQQLLNTAHANAPLNHVPIHKHHQHDTTILDYVRHPIRLMATLMRGDTAFEIPSSDALTAAVDSLRLKIRDGDELLVSDVHAVTRALWLHE